MYIYIDESGNLSKKDGNYFIVGSFTTPNPTIIGKAFLKWRKTKFPKKLHNQSEVKFNDPFINHQLRLKTLQFLTSQDISIYYTYLKLQNIPFTYYKKDQLFKTGLLYAEIVSTTLGLYLPISDNNVQILRDQRTLKGVSKSTFNEIIKASLISQLKTNSTIHINSIDSTESPLIQIADWICGALATYHEKKNYGEDYYSILKTSIVKSKELFTYVND